MKSRIFRLIYNTLNRLKIKQKLLVIYSVAFLLPMVVITVCLSTWFYRLLKDWPLS